MFKPNLKLDFHQTDFLLMEKAAIAAGVSETEFCKLAVHILAQRTLAGEWPSRHGKRVTLAPLQPVGAVTIRRTSVT